MRRSASETCVRSAVCSTPSGSSISWSPSQERSRSVACDFYHSFQTGEKNKIILVSNICFRIVRQTPGVGKQSTSSSKLSETWSVLLRPSVRTELCCRSPTYLISTKCLRGAEYDDRQVLNAATIFLNLWCCLGCKYNVLIRRKNSLQLIIHHVRGDDNISSHKMTANPCQRWTYH